MTTQTLQPHLKTEKSMIRSNKTKILLGGLLIAAVALAWTGVGLAKWVFQAPDVVLVGVVIAAALLTEVALWIGGAVLGVTALSKASTWMRLRSQRS